MREMLGKAGILLARGPAEIIVGELKAFASFFLDLVLLVAIGANRHAGRLRREFGRRAVFVRRADIQDIVSAKALEARIDISRQHRSCEIAEMLDPIDVGQGGRNENAALAWCRHGVFRRSAIEGKLHAPRGWATLIAR